MNVLESHPLLCFFICSLLLYHIYGFAWTLVIIFTLYLLDRTFHDTQSERIFGKPLTRNRKKVQPVNGFCGPSPIVFNKGLVPPVIMSANKDSSAKRPTLQSLLYKKGSSSNDNSKRAAYAHPRQPLAAIVKNNIQMNVSPSIDLERKKPIFQTLRSPLTSPSVYSTRNASPLARRMRSNLNLSSPLRANLSPANNSFSNDKSLDESPGQTLEVHGSYFINKSILHSPATAATIEKPSPRRYFSPSNVTFNTDPQSPASSCASKTSTESVVQALREKSKRKRTIPSTSDEACTKKKKSNEDSVFDSTLNELLPSVPSEKSAKRRNIDDREVMSTGVQCYISDDETVVRKKKKPSDTSAVTKPKFGLSQSELNNLSQEINDTTAMADITDVQDNTDTAVASDKVAPTSSLEKSIRNIAHNCSFKTVSFANSTAATDVVTPDKRLSAGMTRPIDRSASKLSALKSMESPYKKLFSGLGDGLTANVSPASAKKLRKHPIYFTAKIDIDEVQQHHEEFGESGVSLKAFRLNQEESIKRVNSLFDDAEVGSEIDFKVQSSSASLTTTTTSVTTTAISVSANLFGSTSASDSKPTSLFTSSIAASTSGFTFGSSAASVPNATAVSSSAITKTETSVASTSVLTGLKMLNSLSASVPPAKPAETLVVPPAVTAPGTTVSTSVPAAAVPAFNFGSLAVSSATPAATTSVDLALATSTSTSVPVATGLGFSFGAALSEASSSTKETPSQFASLTQPSIIPTSTDQPSKISFSIAIQPTTNIQPTTAVSATTTTSAPTSAAPAFNFSFQPNPPTTESKEPVSTAAQTGFSAPTFNFGASSAAAPSQLGGLSFLSAVSAAAAAPASAAGSLPTSSTTTASSGAIPSLPSVFSFAVASSSTAATTAPPSIFGSATTTQPAQPSLFGSSSTSTSAFGASASTTAASTLPSMFGTSASSAPPSFSFGAATVPSFNQPAASASTAALTAPVPSMFGGSAATSASTSGVGGFSFTPASAAAPTTGFSFSAPSVSSSATATTANIFTGAQSSIFGQTAASTATATPAAAGSIFGSVSTATSSQSIFGAPSTATSSAPAQQNVFGAPAATTAQSSQSIFGGGATQTTFGAPAPAAGGFGATAAAAPNPFATTTAQPASIFGAPQTKPATGGFNFGASAATAPASAPSTGFSFGAATSSSNSIFGASTNSSSVFGGSTAPVNNGSSMFGAAPKPAENIFAQPAKPASGFDFSASLTQGPAINFGSGGGTAAAPAVNSFGAPQMQNEMPKPTFNFGASQPTTPSFASPAASPAFGAAPQPSFGAAPAPTFGTPGAAGGGFTIGAGTSNPPPRQTRNARRRLRR